MAAPSASPPVPQLEALNPPSNPAPARCGRRRRASCGAVDGALPSWRRPGGQVLAGNEVEAVQ